MNAADPLLTSGARVLAAAGVPHARREAAELLGNVLEHPWTEALLSEAELEPEAAARFQALLVRRSRREPLSYVLGECGFGGGTFRVGPGALVPRPETETLLEAADSFLAERLGPRPRAQGRPLLVLDLATGSGVLAVLLAERFREGVRIVASDLSGPALRYARENARRRGVSGRVAFAQGDLLEPFGPWARFDLILANPPYVATGEVDSLPPEIRDWEPLLAIDGGPDGLAFYRRLSTCAPAALSPGGRLVLEVGDGQALAVAGILAGAGLQVGAIVPDLAGTARVVAASLPVIGCGASNG